MDFPVTKQFHSRLLEVRMPEINIEEKASFEAISDKLSELAKKLASHASAEQAMLQSGGADPSAPAGTSANFFELLASANEMNEQLQVAINDLGKHKPLASIDTMVMRGERSEVPSSVRENLPDVQLESGRNAELGEDVASKADLEQTGHWLDRVLEAAKSTSVSINALEDNISTLQRTQNNIGSNVGNVLRKTESISRSTAAIYKLSIEVSAAKDELVAARKDMAELPKFGNERSNMQLTLVEAIIGIILAIAGTFFMCLILVAALKATGLWDLFIQFLRT